MNNKRSLLLKYGITIIIALAISAWYYFSNNGSTLKGSDLYKVLADAFTIPGIFILMFGLIIFASNEGALDALSYVVHYAGRTLVPFGRLKKPMKYAEYKESRKEHNISGYSFMLVVGIIFCLIAVVFIMLFHSNQS